MMTQTTSPIYLKVGDLVTQHNAARTGATNMSDDVITLMHWIHAYRGPRCADEPVKNEAYYVARRWAAHIIAYGA